MYKRQSLYGEECRTCYTDEVKAVEAERRLRLSDLGESDDGDEDRAQANGDRYGEHVIMCDTLRPPSSPDCNSKCRIKLDTVSACVRTDSVPATVSAWGSLLGHGRGFELLTAGPRIRSV